MFICGHMFGKIIRLEGCNPALVESIPEQVKGISTQFAVFTIADKSYLIRNSHVEKTRFYFYCGKSSSKITLCYLIVIQVMCDKLLDRVSAVILILRRAVDDIRI